MLEVTASPVHLGDTDLKICLTNSGPDEYLNVIFVIGLPTGIMRLRGQEKIGPVRLLPGKTVCEKLLVRAEKPGRYRLTSPNFSYQDHNGKPHREPSFSAEIIVYPAFDPPGPAPEPRIRTELQTHELPLGEWTVLNCRLSNVGDAAAEKLELSLSGQVTVDERSRRFALDRLAAGAAVNVSYYVRAQEAGARVPLHFDLTWSGPCGRRPDPTVTTVSVSGNPTPALKSPQSPRELVKVLYLAANPVDPVNPGRRRLRVDEEFREIQQTVSQGRERDNIQLESRWAVQPRDITQALFAVEPHFVHFAGHGNTKEESIVVGDEYGYSHTIPVDGLVQAFQAAGQGVRCVVVNACSTERLAQALATAGLCVIGMRQPVGDHSAVRFSVGFYQALAAGRSVKTAFDAGVAQLMMSPLRDDDRAPFLLCGGQVAR
jgi:CHAT domain